MLTKTQLEVIFDAVAEKHGVYLTEKGSDAFQAFDAFQSTIQEINHPNPPFHEMEMTDDAGVVAQFLEHLNKKKQKNQSPLSFKQFQGELDGFKVTLQNLLMNSSRAIFLSEAKKEASCLGIDEEAISKLITLAAHPNFFGQFIKIVTKLKNTFDKDLQLKTAIESALKACNPEVSLGDPRRQEKLRALINSTVKNNEPLLYILQNLNIVSTQRFADMKKKDLSFSSFKKEVLLGAYRTSLSRQGKSPFDHEGHLSKFTQHFLDHFVPATTYAAAVTLEKTIKLKQEEALPEAINIKKSHGKPNYELTRINVTPVDVDNPKHWLCYHLGDAVNCCLHAGGNSERCIIDGLTKSTSGFYVITEKKGRENAKKKICAAIYAFMSRKGNLVLDSIEPLNAGGKSEYASLVHDLVIEFAASVVQDTQREHPIQRVCLGTGGNTDLCFDQKTLTHKALPSMHEQTQKGTFQYGDSSKVIVLAHSAAEEARLQALIDALVGTREESDIEDTQGLRTIVRELLLTYCADLFYVEETNDIGQYIAHLKLKGLQLSFQRDEASEIQGLLTLESFYKEAFALMLPWVCQDRNIAFMNFFLKKGVDIDTTDSHGKTALCTACRHGQTAIIELLLTTSVDINLSDKEGKTPLFWAARNGHTEAIRALRAAGADVNFATLLHSAAANNHKDMVNILLAVVGIDVNLADKQGRTALSLAAANNHKDTVNILLAAGGIDVNLADRQGRTALSLAAGNNHKDTVNILLAADGIDVNLADSQGRTALSLAAENNHKDTVNILLAAGGIDVNIPDIQGKTALSLVASGSGRVEMIKILLATPGINFNHMDNQGRTALSWAAKNGHVEIVKELLRTPGIELNLTTLSLVHSKRQTEIINSLLTASGIDVNLATREERTPLTLAAENGYIEIVNALLSMPDIDFNHADIQGRTPLYWAVIKGHTEIVKALLAVLKIDLNIKDNEGRTLLCWAVIKGHTEIVKALLTDLKIDLNIKDNEGRTPLCWAAENGYGDIIKELMNCPEIEFNIKDNQGRTPLSLAAKNAHLEIVKEFLDCPEIEFNIKDKQGKTALSLAAENAQAAIYRRTAMVKILLAADGIDVNVADNDGRTPLSLSVIRQQVEILKILLANPKIEVNYRDNRGRTPFSLAVTSGNAEIVDLLLADPNIDVNLADKNGITPLEWSLDKGQYIIRSLLNRGANIDTKISEKFTGLSGGIYELLKDEYSSQKRLRSSLFSLKLSNEEEICRRLKWLRVIDLCSKTRGDAQLLLRMVNIGAKKALDLLIKRSVSSPWEAVFSLPKNSDKDNLLSNMIVESYINFRDKQGRTPLCCAAQIGDTQSLKRLLAIPETEVNREDNEGRTALSLATEKGHIEIVHLLLDTRDIDFNHPDNEGRTALSLAAEHSHVEIVTKLLAMQAIDHALLAMPAIDFNYSDSQGRTPLYWAAEHGHVEIVTKLLDIRDIDFNHPDNAGRTALSLAAEKGHINIVTKLLDIPEINFNHRDNEGRTALSLALSKSHIEIVNLLPSASKFDVNHPDNQGRTLLSLAAENGYLEIVTQLLAIHGIDVNLADSQGRTALFLAAENGHTEIVQLLLGTFVIRVDFADNEGRTALSLAAGKGRIEIVKLLLEAGADVDLADHIGRRPLLWAVSWAYQNTDKEEIVKVLLEAGAGINTLPNQYIISSSLSDEEKRKREEMNLFSTIFSYGQLAIAGLKAQDKYGKSALSLASPYWNYTTKLYRLLEEESISQKILRKSLYTLTKMNEAEICRRLKGLYSIDLNKTENGDHQLLFRMAKIGAINALDLLMQRSRDDINRPDEKGHTALYHAVKEGQADMVKHILNKYQPDLIVNGNDYDTLLSLTTQVDAINLHLRAHRDKPTVWTAVSLLLSKGLGKQNDNHSNHPGY